jgi:hypothetical protein
MHPNELFAYVLWALFIGLLFILSITVVLWA